MCTSHRLDSRVAYAICDKAVLHLDDVIRHSSGRDTSLRCMCTSHRVPLKVSADRRGKNLLITITQGQLT